MYTRHYCDVDDDDDDDDDYPRLPADHRMSVKEVRDAVPQKFFEGTSSQH